MTLAMPESPQWRRALRKKGSSAVGDMSFKRDAQREILLLPRRKEEIGIVIRFRYGCAATTFWPAVHGY